MIGETAANNAYIPCRLSTGPAYTLAVSVQQKKLYPGISFKKAVNLPQTKIKQHGASR